MKKTARITELVKYPVKCTFCHVLISNLYEIDDGNYYFDGKDWILEADTQREADIIATLENLSKETQRYYTMLADEKRIEPNL